MLLRTLALLIIFSTYVYSDEIPIMTILVLNKKPQSLSTVGTSVTIIDEKFLSNSTKYKKYNLI